VLLVVLLIAYRTNIDQGRLCDEVPPSDSVCLSKGIEASWPILSGMLANTFKPVQGWDVGGISVCV
jgi:hypothetical protein